MARTRLTTRSNETVEEMIQRIRELGMETLATIAQRTTDINDYKRNDSYTDNNWEVSGTVRTGEKSWDNARFEVTARHTINIDTTVDDGAHLYQVVTSYVIKYNWRETHRVTCSTWQQAQALELFGAVMDKMRRFQESKADEDALDQLTMLKRIAASERALSEQATA